MTAAVIHLPADPARLRAGMSAVRARATTLRATPEARRLALGTLLQELRDGRSTAAAVAMANGTLRRSACRAQGGAA